MKYFDDILFDNFACGTTIARKQNSSFPGYYGIQLVQEGNIEVSINGRPFEKACGPVVFLTFPGVRYTYGSPPGESRVQANVCFSGSRVDHYVSGGLFPLKTENIFMYPASPLNFFQQFQELLRSLALPDEYHRAHSVLLLENILLQITMQDSRLQKFSSVYWPEFNKFIKAVAGSPQNEWDFHAEAKRIGISDSHFRRIFKQITGFSPVQYLIECRITLAKQMLLTSGKRVNEIGRELHFENEFHFSRIFRKKVGKSPAQFRKFYT